VKVETLLSTARKHLVTVRDDARLTEAAVRLGHGRANLVIVCDLDGRMAGVVSRTDIVARISVCAGHSCTEMVATVMTREVVACRSEDRLEDVWSRMKTHGLVNLPVVDPDHRPMAVLTAQDALETLLGETNYEKALLRDYLLGIGYR